MKVDDSGMPEEDYWNNLFNIPLIINWLDLKRISDPIVEVGCGYGTFTLPIAKETKNQIYTDEDPPQLLDFHRQKTQAEV
jgi:16S rRNA A1518/A1519 N6-dimethyltransferase RsmA/KsgA/DIM1 with predicted DNA glycosylase/AP lyase activity